MRYLVLGCGAIGGVVAAGLARDGHDVLASDTDAEVVSAVSQHGISVTGPVEQFTARVPAVLPAELPWHLDRTVLVAVKSLHMADAAASLAGRISDPGFVVCLSNGLNAAVLADAIGPGRVVEACVNFGADAIRPGVVRRGNRATFVVGELDGTISERVRTLAADLNATVTGNIVGYVWAKQAYGALLAATAVSDLPICDILADPRYGPLLTGLAGEVLAQAPAPVVPLDGFDPADLTGSLTRLAAFNRASAKTHSGIYLDLAAGRPTEVHAILGGLARPDAPLVGRLVEVVAAIERGDRRCDRANVDLLAAHERLERLGRPLNAVVAAIAAPSRASGGPLAGQPVAVKDIIAVAGVPTRCGSRASDDTPAASDATLVARLRVAGAEVFATTQCLEYAAGFAHPQVGGTRNPHDPGRTSGGSSGGSAALVAAGVCDLAVGTDTGGSIRIPAAYCGIVGLKPSYGLLPLDGVFPLSTRCDHAGTLTTDVAGALRLLAVLAGRELPAGAARQPARAAFCLGILSAQLTDPSVTAQVRAAIDGALRALDAADWELRELSAPWLGRLADWEAALAVIVASQAHQVHQGRDTGRYCDGTRALLEFGASVSEERFAAALAEQAELTAAIDESLAGVDALAGPTVGYQAPEEDPPFGLGDDNAEGRFTGTYNLTGHPALSLPVPSCGLPAGLQLAGRLHRDFQLLRVAAAAERVLSTDSTRKD